jgi:menaquinone-dependent protoporphyrinogen oxidase
MNERRFEMENKILVTYASVSGSMQEVAAAVAETLRSHSLDVELLPLRKVRKLDGYRAIVLGAPLYMFRWHKDALRFLSRYQQVLTTSIPVAIFAGGPFLSKDEKEPDEKVWQEVQTQLKKELARYPWFKPVSIQIVGGRFDPAKLRFPYNLIPALKQLPASDLRDWTEIRAWADSLALKFIQPA